MIYCKPYPPAYSNALLRKSLLLLSLLGVIAPVNFAQSSIARQDRGVWFWQSPDSPYGSSSVVGNATLEDQTITRMKSWGITTVYGAYSSHGNIPPAALRAWNRKLAKCGIASYLLLSETDYFFPEKWSDASDVVLKNVVEFNRQSSPDERFIGVAFDIEPHILRGSPYGPSWKDTDPKRRREYLADFLTFFQKTRALLDQHGASDVRIEASLTTWYSRLGGKIEWGSTADRDQWFAQLARVCNRVSIMDFETPSTAVILDRVHDEVDLLHGHARIALRANLGKEWKSTADFWGALHTIETDTHQSVDIQDYALLCADEGGSKQN
jgi:hypothetical protein